MRIFVICNSDSLAIPMVQKLLEQNHLIGIAITKKAKKLLLPRLKALDLGFEPVVLDRKNWDEQLSFELYQSKAEAVWAITFPWKVPDELLNIPPQGFINFHFGLLPKYAGADPIFWQFKNLEESGGLTVHLMTTEIDEGPVLLQEKLPVMPGENYGFHCMRLGTFAVTLFDEIIRRLEEKPRFYLDLPIPELVINTKPSKADLTIDWANQKAQEIEWLVNACNPFYGGAKTNMNEVELRVLEVTPVSFSEPIDAKPGQIVLADATYGVVVACANNECLRITIVKTGEGYLSGVKLFNLGFTQGNTFG